MKTSIIAMTIAAAMAVASCGQKKVEEELSEPIESSVEETPTEEVWEEEVIETPAEETPEVSEEQLEEASTN
ncbi:hypothetical protein [Lunatimonas salinarum]|uniref:hypothetical protein n=1 Tax=Lunatimonas salinarum TaxID=1774590 RepID=UPI001AE0BA43|nr:hypothetical protein [Lunatimonas salinarum]